MEYDVVEAVEKTNGLNSESLSDGPSRLREHRRRVD
jgi:hypothetical protein